MFRALRAMKHSCILRPVLFSRPSRKRNQIIPISVSSPCSPLASPMMCFVDQILYYCTHPTVSSNHMDDDDQQWLQQLCPVRPDCCRYLGYRCTSVREVRKYICTVRAPPPKLNLSIRGTEFLVRSFGILHTAAAINTKRACSHEYKHTAASLYRYIRVR